MPVSYTSRRFPTNFIRADETIIQNGSLALASTAHTIAENQAWLALADTPFVNFLTLGQGVTMTTRSFNVTVKLPPYATHVAFYFYYFHDFDSSGSRTTDQYIDISSSVESSRATNLPFGEDMDDTAPPRRPYDFTGGGWVFFDGLVPNPQETTPQAIQVVSAQAGTWRTATVAVDVSANIALLSGAYRVLPNVSGYEVTV